MRQNYRLRAILNTMAEKQIQVLALAEVRCPGDGVSQIGDSVIVYSGLSADDPHHRCRGVAVVLSERVASAWRVACSVLDPVSERLLHIPLKSHTGFLSLIVVYAPTNEPKNEEESVAFYQALQECVRQVLRRDMLVIMGNARVENDAATWQGTIGRFGAGELNENGERLLNFCALNDMVVTNTLFQHRPCHQHTWFHPAQSSHSGHMLDYVLVSQQFCSSILDTRVYRKTNLESDHRLVVSKVRLKLKARRKRAQRYPRHQVDARYLEDQQMVEFQRLLNESLAAGPKSDVEEAWCSFKEGIRSAQSCLPLISETADEDWVTDEARDGARRKKEGWMRWQKFLDNRILDRGISS